MKTRSSSYRFTVKMQNGKPAAEDAILVESLRNSISIENSHSSVKKYVKLQGRGHRRGNPRYNQSLPLSFADSADVYIYTR